MIGLLGFAGLSVILVAGIILGRAEAAAKQRGWWK